jgi:hypothetical protein
VATVSCHVDASCDAVFAVLAEGWFYSNWVVGTSHVRAVQDEWPTVGSKLFHASGVWPVVARDETEVEEEEPGRLLVLTARGRPLGEARVRIELEPSETGTTITMHETPVAGPGKWLNSPLTETVLARRNAESLARLTALVERHTQP